MRRRPNDMSTSSSDGRHRSPLTKLLLFLLATSLLVVYLGLTTFTRRPINASSTSASDLGNGFVPEGEEEEGDCCRGLEKLELWGPAVKWGTDFKFESSKECCRACKEMCRGLDGPCLCDSWVFCGDKGTCGEKFGECWLKKQKDVMHPAVRDSGDQVMWTSGLIFGKGEGIIGLETQHGVLRIKLFPECAPRSVNYILELFGLRHCAGCEFYRAESRGSSWDSKGNHIDGASYGPPYALLQGILKAEGTPFPGIPKEACPSIRRGSVAWVGSGPEFIIGLANHDEWRRSYTVFGSVLSEDMVVVEKIATLPTTPDIWSNINVTVLNKPVSLKLKWITMAS